MIPALAIAASAGAFFLSTGLGVLWPLAWLAPIPALLLAFNRSWRVTAAVAFASFLLGSFTILSLFRLGGLIVFAGPPSIAFTLAVLAARAAQRQLPPWTAALVFPGIFTAYEFLYGSFSPNGTYWSIGYSQTDVLPLLQVVSLTGLWGVIFCLMLVPSAIAVAWHRRSLTALAPAFVVLGLTLGYGGMRLWLAPASASVRVGLAASDERAQTLDLAHAYADRIRRLGADGAELIVLPEKLAAVSPQEVDAVAGLFSDAARLAHVTAVIGINRIDQPLNHNVAMVFAPTGRVIAVYEKHHLVPIIETPFFARGETPQLFDGPGAQWGVAICKDMDFGPWSREYGRRGVRVLAVPALDFNRDGRLHSRMALTRGVENGFAVARSAGHGLVTISDAYGRVLAEQSTIGVPEARVVQRVPAGPGATPYTRYGDWFGWATILLLVALLLAALMRASSSGSRSLPAKSAPPAIC